MRTRKIIIEIEIEPFKAVKTISGSIASYILYSDGEPLTTLTEIELSNLIRCLNESKSAE